MKPAGRTCRSRHTRSKRLFQFTGTETQYITYLERQVSSLLQQQSEPGLQARASLCCECGSSPMPSVSSKDSSLVFRIETPGTRQAPVSSARKLSQRPKWEELDERLHCEGAAADFLAKVPASGARWSETKNLNLLSTPQQVVDAFSRLTLRSDAVNMGLPVAGDMTTSQATVRAYQRLEGVLSQHAANASQLHRYSLLVFFCICYVARDVGMGVEEVDQMISACLPNRKPSSVYSMKLRNAAKLIAGVIDQLEKLIGYRASQLFLLYGPPMETYRTWADQSTTANYLAQQISAKMAWETSEPADVRLSFSPAFLVTYVGPWSLDTVNKALNTNLGQEEYMRRVQDTERLVKRYSPPDGGGASRDLTIHAATAAPGLESMISGYSCERDMMVGFEHQAEVVQERSPIAVDWEAYARDGDFDLVM